MYKSIIRCVAVSFVVCGTAWSPFSTADVTSGGVRFYEESEYGWFYHDDPPSDPEPEIAPAPLPQPSPAKVDSPAESSSASGPPAFSAQWFRTNYPKIVDQAVDDPTPDNVKAMRTAQRIMMDKGSAFQEEFARQVVLDTELDENLRKPRSTFGSNIAAAQAKMGEDELLNRIAETQGIWFFYSSSCPYCEKQAPILASLAENYGISVTAISLDGLPLRSGYFPDYKIDGGHAQQLDVNQTPTMFVVRPPNDFVQLGASVLSLNELKYRLLTISESQGWITPEDVDKSRSVKRVQLADSKLIKSAESVTANPHDLISEIRKRLREDF